MEVATAIVLLKSASEVSAEKVAAELAKLRGEKPTLAPTGAGKEAFRFIVDDMMTAGGLVPAAVPWEELEPACASSVFWPEAADELQGHGAHVIVAVGGKGSPIEKMRLLTQATTAVLDSCEGAIGVDWTLAGMVLPAVLFSEIAAQVMPHGPPVFLWIDCRVGTTEAGHSEGYTTGLEALGHLEFETEDAHEPPEKLRDRFYRLAAYVIEKGPVIHDGDTVGEDADHKIHIEIGASQFGHPGTVMRLVHSRGPANTP